MKKWMLLVALPLLAACDRTADFEFAFTNRDTTAIVPQINANEYDIEIAAGNSHSFTVELEILESSPTGPRTADVAYVTVAARSAQRRRISRPYTLMVYGDRVNPVTVNLYDFH